MNVSKYVDLRKPVMLSHDSLKCFTLPPFNRYFCTLDAFDVSWINKKSMRRSQPADISLSYFGGATTAFQPSLAKFRSPANSWWFHTTSFFSRTHIVFPVFLFRYYKCVQSKLIVPICLITLMDEVQYVPTPHSKKT